MLGSIYFVLQPWMQYLCPRGFLFSPNGVHARPGTRGHDHGDNCYVMPWDVLIKIEWNIDPTVLIDDAGKKIEGSQINRYFDAQHERMFTAVQKSNEYFFFNFTEAKGTKTVHSFFHFWLKYAGEIKPEWPKYHWFYGMLIFRGFDMLHEPKGYDKYFFPPLMYDHLNDCFKGGSKPDKEPEGIALCPGAYSSSPSASSS
jgi:hypothetical protein